MDKELIRNAKNFDELLDIKYGKIGTEKRDGFEERAQYYVISAMLKEARKEAKMTKNSLLKRLEPRKVIFLDLKMGNVIFNCPHYSGYLNLDLGKELIS